MANHFMNKLNLNILCISLSYDAHHIPNSGEYSRLIFNIPYFLNTIYLTKICVNYRIWLQNFHDLKIHNSTSIGCIKSSFETSIVHLTQRLARRRKNPNSSSRYVTRRSIHHTGWLYDGFINLHFVKWKFCQTKRMICASDRIRRGMLVKITLK